MTPDAWPRVLRLLGGRLGAEVRFARKPTRMSGGAFSEVYAFEILCGDRGTSRPLVLRAFADDADPVQPRLEEVLQNAVADAGFPAPRVLLAECDPERVGARFLVMERLRGRGFLRGIRWHEFARDFPRLLARWPRMLVDVTERLHRLDPAGVVDAAAARGLAPAALSVDRHLAFVRTWLGEARRGAIAPALEWLRANEPPPAPSPAIVHGDLWPANVLVERGRLRGLVDWGAAGVGDPALDIGFACAGLALMPAPFPPPPPVRQGIRLAGLDLARRVRGAWTARTGGDARRVAFYEALRCLLELATVVRFRRTGAAGSSRAKPPPWAGGIDALESHVAAVTGVRVAIG